MHRSGTSALTRVLALLGCALPRNLIGGDESNLPGHWESWPICDLNDRILAAAGSKWQDWRRFESERLDPKQVEKFGVSAHEVLQAEFGDAQAFVLKDPRMCRLAPFWLDALTELGTRPLVVIPLRNPLEVAASLHRRNRLSHAYSYLLWLRHVLDAEHDTRGRDRLFTTYDGLLGGWRSLAEKVGAMLEGPWPRDFTAATADIEEFLSLGQRHHSEPAEHVLADESLPRWLRETYRILLRWTEAGEDAGDFAALDAIRQELDESAKAFGDLITEGRKSADAVQRLKRELHVTRMSQGSELMAPWKAVIEEDAGLSDATKDRVRELASLSQSIRETSHVRQSVADQIMRSLAVLLDAQTWPKLTAELRIERQMDILEGSGLFDGEWYLRCYGDVSEAGDNPTRHFVEYGFGEGRAPNSELFAYFNHRQMRGAS